MKTIKLYFAALCCMVASFAYATCSPVNVSYLTSGFGDCTTDNSTIWTWDSYNYAKATAYQKNLDPSTVNLFTPALDLDGSESVTLSFSHAHRFAGTPSDELTLWVTKDFKGDYASSTWQQLTINPYSTNTSWTWVDVTIDVPVSYVGANTVFAFHYKWTSSNTATWEIKKLNITSTCAGGGIAAPVPLPEVGDARLKVFAQNLRNYYIHYNEGRGNYSEAEIAEKTQKIVNAMMMVDADIFALCEVEAQPEVLPHLASAMNTFVGEERYVAVSDDAVEEWDATYDNNIKSGFIYRKDKVKPYGNNNAATTAEYYKRTMRIQVFEELETGERFTLSMNHFKANDNSEDGGNEKRIINANQVLSGLTRYASDPDILMVGDFNCQKGSDPYNIIVNADYAEQLLKNDPNAYAYCFQGDPNLIDHAFANASMEEQITGVGVFHISTSCGEYGGANYNYRYSDHDPYVIGLKLIIHDTPTECQDIDVTLATTGGTSFAPMTSESVSGSWSWQYDATYGATCMDKGGEDWLFTPEYNLSNSENIQISFQHTVGYATASNITNEHTLWVTKDFQGNVASSTWEQLTIPTYPTTGSNWPPFVTATINVPENVVGEKTVFAFKYKVEESSATNKPKWEVKNVKIKATCKGEQGIEDVQTAPRAIKTIENGQLILLLPDGTRYNVLGIQIQ